MKLFFQLTTECQDLAVKECIRIVIQDLINGNVRIEPLDDKDLYLQETIELAMMDIASIPNDSDKLNHLMENDVFVSAIKDVANELARNVYYAENDEIVIPILSLAPEKLLTNDGHMDASTVEDDMDDDQFFDLKTHTVKKPHSIN